jgi:hypothetical protein
MVTYLIENDKKQVVGYSFRLSDAKEYLLDGQGTIITKLVGSYRYEGFHHYYMRLENGKFVKELTYNGKK